MVVINLKVGINLEIPLVLNLRLKRKQGRSNGYVMVAPRPACTLKIDK